MELKFGAIQVKIAMMFGVLMSVLGCMAPGVQEESTTATEDTSIPTVIGISPADGTSSVSLNSTISVTFSKSIEPLYVTLTAKENCSGTVLLSADGFNTCIPAVATYDSSRKVYTLTPGTSTATRDLNTSSNHQVKVTTSVKDYFSVAFSDNYTSSGFTTASVCSPGCSWADASASGLTAGSGHTVAVHLGKLWSLGGYDGSNASQKVYYSDDGKTWTDVSASGHWSARNEHAATAFDGKLWVMGGGNNGTGLLNDVWSSGDGKTWTQVSSAASWSARRLHSVLVFSDKIYLLGGIDSSSNNLNDVWSSSDGKIWTQITDDAAWSKRYGQAAEVFNNKLWVMGGANTSSAGLADVWSSEDGSSWTQATTSGSMWSARSGHTATVFDGKLWVIGGNSGSGTLNSWSSTDGSVWTDVGIVKSNKSSRSGSDAAVVSNRIYVVGGDDGSSTNRYKSDVFKYGP